MAVPDQPGGEKTLDAAHANASWPAELSDEEVWAELNRLLASVTFRRASRLKSLLQHVVACGLERSDARLREYAIGREVFGKPESYDPRRDPLVRVETSRLRAKLRKYYETEGCADPVIIAVRKGVYRPLFERRPKPNLPGLAGAVVRAPALTALPAPDAAGPPRTTLGAVGQQGLSIVVLPFVDLSPKGDQGYFADGLTVEIINALARVHGLQVVARSSAFQFRGAAQDIQQIREKLHVGAIVEGSVRKENERLRISLHVIDSSNGYLIWTDEFEGPVTGLLALQDRIAAAIVGLFRVQLRGAGRSFPAHSRPVQAIRIYNLYLKGLYHLSRRTERELKKAIECFNRTLAKDPGYAPALAQLANGYVSLALSSAVLPDEVMPRAKAAALRALEIDQSMPDAHAALALVRSLYDRDWLGAEQGFRLATHIAPRLPATAHWYAIGYLMPLGELDEAAARLGLAHQLDPLSTIINTHMGVLAHMRGRHEEAIERLSMAIELDPKFYRAHWDLGRVYAHLSMFGEAFAELKKAKALGGGSPFRLGSLGYCLGRAGKKAEAVKILDELRESAKKGHAPSYDMAETHLGLGEKEQALSMLERAYDERSPWLARLKVDPVFTGLRNEARYGRLVGKMGLERRDQASEQVKEAEVT
jgi:serine/threonine-protein kinase